MGAKGNVTLLLTQSPRPDNDDFTWYGLLPSRSLIVTLMVELMACASGPNLSSDCLRRVMLQIEFLRVFLLTLRVVPACSESRKVGLSTGVPYTGTTRGATVETNETVVFGVNGTVPRTVWFSWTAAVTGKYTISTEGSVFDTVLSVYSLAPPSLSDLGPP